jgi:hypothetical protein
MPIRHLLIPLSFLILATFLPACQNPDHEQLLDKIEPLAIENFELFANFEEQGLVRPVQLEVLPTGEVAVLDGHTNKVQFIDPDGNVTASFGGEGRGPGESLSASQLLLADESLFVVDFNLYRINRFTLSGEYVGSFSFESGMFGNELALMDSNIYYIQTMGENESLIKEINIQSGSENYFGEAKGEEFHFDNVDKDRRTLQGGEVPGFMRNEIRMIYSDNHLFVFLNTLSILKKYTTEGELLWEKEIVMPVNQIVFDNAISQLNSDDDFGGIPSISYILSMKVIDQETYLQWYPVDEYPQYLVRVDQDGEIKRIYQTPSDQFRFFEFSIDYSRDVIYFIDYETSEVYRAAFPDL